MSHTVPITYEFLPRNAGSAFSITDKDGTQLATGTVPSSGFGETSITLPDAYKGGVYLLDHAGNTVGNRSFDFTDSEGIAGIPAAVASYVVGTSEAPVNDVGELGRGLALLQRAPYTAPTIVIPDIDDAGKATIVFAGQPRASKDAGSEVVVTYVYAGPVEVGGHFDNVREKTAITDVDGIARIKVYPSSALTAAGIAEVRYKIRCDDAALSMLTTVPDDGLLIELP